MVDRVVVLACREACRPIPFQLDERDVAGRPALDSGPEPNPDEPPGEIDGNDEIVWMLDDAGRRMRAGESPADAQCGYRVHVRLADFDGWFYVFSVPPPAPRSPLRYVEYDAARDVMRGARVSMGFGGPTPLYIAVRGAAGADGPNLLDRLKVRASAWFLGLVPLGRDEDDIRTQFVAWHAGPIRIVRRQRQWVRLGWGLRTPIFRTDTYFYRDFGVLPVHLRLNFPPTFFFRGIEVRAVLDFLDLAGWEVIAPGLGESFTVGTAPKRAHEKMNRLRGDWFALRGPAVTFVEILTVGPTLSSLRRELVYREGNGGRGPEDVPGEMPGIGYRLTRWGDVDSGAHWFSSTSYAIPRQMDPARFVRELGERQAIETRPYQPPPAEPLGE
jgi:hypothetical protein